MRKKRSTNDTRVKHPYLKKEWPEPEKKPSLELMSDFDFTQFCERRRFDQQKI